MHACCIRQLSSMHIYADSETHSLFTLVSLMEGGVPQWFWSELPCLRQLFCSLLQDNPLVRLISEVVGLGPGPDPSWVELRPMGLKSRLGRFLLSNSERKARHFTPLHNLNFVFARQSREWTFGLLPALNWCKYKLCP